MLADRCNRCAIRATAAAPGFSFCAKGDPGVTFLRRAFALSRIAQLDQRTALPDQCLHLAEADVRPPRRKSGFDTFSDMQRTSLIRSPRRRGAEATVGSSTQLPLQPSR